MSYKIETMIFEIEVEQEASNLVREGVPPWIATKRAMESVRKKRQRKQRQSSGMNT